VDLNVVKKWKPHEVRDWAVHEVKLDPEDAEKLLMNEISGATLVAGFSDT
jgi:hypothetical protein